MVEQALVRSERGRGDSFQDFAFVGATDSLIEKGRQDVGLVAGKRGVARKERREVSVVERRPRVVLGEMEVRAGVECDPAIREGRVGVDQVTLVLRNLPRRVKVVTRP